MTLEDDLNVFDEDGEYVGSDGSDGGGGVARGSNFQDRFERYMQSLMGSQDAYCCPLCYIEADRRIGNADDEEVREDVGSSDDDDGGDGDGVGDYSVGGAAHRGASDAERKDCFSFLDDPLTILASLDLQQFEVAATFCFRLLREVKEHLREVHKVDIKEIEGSDLFKRFQIRAGDGLLQSWLKRSLRQNVAHGDMMRYWLNGENQSFILLLSQIDKAHLRGEHSGEYGGDFSRSFPNRARRTWRDVSAPYLKEQDMGDFIAGESEEEEGDDGPDVRVNPHFTPPDGEGGDLKSPVDQMIQNLQRKNFARTFPFGEDDSSESDDTGGDDELEVLPKPPQYEEEEEEDEWTKSKGLSAKKSRSNLKSNAEDSEDDGFFGSDGGGEPGTQTQANGSARKRVIEDGNDLSDADGKPTTNAPASARKRVLESSDEESY